jgi:hypothetical protein
MAYLTCVVVGTVGGVRKVLDKNGKKIFAELAQKNFPPRSLAEIKNQFV